MRARSKKAFTLLEFLIVIVLIGALLTLTVANVAVLPTENMRTPQGFLTVALKQARIDSQNLGAGVSLFFDAEARDLVAFATESGEELWRMNMLGEKQVPEGEEDTRSDYDLMTRKKIDLKFFPRFPETVNMGVPVSSSLSELGIPAVRFHPDGASSPVRIVLKVEGEQDVVFIPDPFSGHSFSAEPKTRRSGR